MTSPRKIILYASAAALLLSVLPPLAANANETTYKNHGDCVSNAPKGGEARSTVARSGCEEPPPPPSSDASLAIVDVDICRMNTVDHRQYTFGVAPSALNYTPDWDQITFSWDFGDGSPLGTGQGTVYTYTQDGTYTVTVTVTDPAMGLSASDSTTFDVNVDTPLYVYTATGEMHCWDLAEPDGIDV